MRSFQQYQTDQCTMEKYKYQQQERLRIDAVGWFPFSVCVLFQLLFLFFGLTLEQHSLRLAIKCILQYESTMMNLAHVSISLIPSPPPSSSSLAHSISGIDLHGIVYYHYGHGLGNDCVHLQSTTCTLYGLSEYQLILLIVKAYTNKTHRKKNANRFEPITINLFSIRFDNNNNNNISRCTMENSITK